MRKSNFLTPKQEREEILRQTLIHEAYDSQPYYKNNNYVPSGVIKTENMEINELYDAIDNYGLRLESINFKNKSPENLAYIDQTQRIGKKIADVMERQVKSGIMTPQIYNGLMAYNSNVIESALNQKPRIKKDVNDPTIPFKILLSANLTNDPAKEVEKLSKAFGMSQKEIINSIRSITERQSVFNDDPVQQGGITTQFQNDANPITVSVDGGGENITYTRAQKLYDDDIQEERVDAGIMNPQGDASSYSNRSEIAGQEQATNMFGLSYKDYSNLMIDVNNLFKSAEDQRLDFVTFTKKLHNIGGYYGKAYKKFELGKFMTVFLEKYKHNAEMGYNEPIDNMNDANSAAGQQADKIKNILEGDARRETNATGEHDHKHTVGEAQIDAKNVGPKEQLNNSMINAPDSINIFFGLILKKQQPIADRSAGDNIVNDMDFDLQSLENIDKALKRPRQSGFIIPSDQLVHIRNMFNIESLLMIQNVLLNTNYTDWDTYEPIRNPYPGKSIRELKKADKNLLELYQVSLNILRRVIEKYKKSENDYKEGWKLQKRLASSAMPVEEVAKSFLQIDTKNVGPSGALSGEGRRLNWNNLKKISNTRKQYYHIGSPAMTTQIPNPPMRYTIN